jgi:hypothetical protein
MESAASVLGLAQRIPDREVVALPAAEPFPKALAGSGGTCASHCLNGERRLYTRSKVNDTLPHPYLSVGTGS